MKLYAMFVPVFVMVLAALGIAPRGSEKPQDASQDMPETLRRGPEHELLQKYAGDWDTVANMIGPGGEEKTKGSMVRKKIGTFHVQDLYTGEMMGMPFTGGGVLGYCKVKKEFFSTWVDSMTPSPVTMTGSYDEKAKEIKMKGTCFGQSGGLEPCRSVTKFIDDDHFTFTLWATGPDKKEFKCGTIEYTRRK